MTLQRRERVEQLAQLLDGRLPADDARRDVRRLARLATTVTTEIALPRLEDDARDRIRTRVLAEVHTDLHAATDTARGSARLPRSARAAVASGVASVLIGTGGVAVAAQEALPGDTLYGLKQATESVRVAAASDLTEQGRVELRLAEERLEELTAATARGDVRDEALVDTLGRMDERSRAGADALVRVAERSGEPALLDEVARFTEQQATGLVAVFDALPVTVRPHAEDSLAALRTIRDELLDPLLGGQLTAAEGSPVTELLRSAPLPPAPVRTSEPEIEGRQDAGTASDGTPEIELPDPPALPTPGSRTSGGNDGGTPRRVVPRLPGPLDDVGRTVDETVGGVLDGTGKLLEDTGETLDGVLDGTGQVLDDTLDDVGGLLDGTVGGLGGLLDGGSTD